MSHRPAVVALADRSVELAAGTFNARPHPVWMTHPNPVSP